MLPESASPVVNPLAADWEDVADGDSLLLPSDPCPVCGSLEKWRDILGGEHCQHCEGETLDKALKMAEVAAQRRTANPSKPRKAAA